MAMNCNNVNSPVPYKEIEEANKDLNESPPQVHDNLIDALPMKSFGPRQLRLYQGFWFPDFILRGALTMQKDFQSRPTDLFLVSYPKSGTTWLKAIMFALMTRTKYSFDQHPLLTHNPHQCVATAELELAMGRSSSLEAIPSPRILSTHLPYSMLPNSITNSSSRIIYVWRDPKDVLVSLYHFIYNIINKGDHKAPFDDIFDSFCDGASNYGPIWDHVLDCWKENMANPNKFLFLKYEEMLQDPIKHVKRVAEFIGCPFSQDEENDGVAERIVELCSFQKQKDLKVNKTEGQGVIAKISYSAFFRKGSTGDWMNYMTPQMAKKLDAIAEEKFKGSGLEIILKANVESNSIE